MSVVLDRPAAVEPPDSLPVAYLSVSSLNLYSRCPMAWKRRYIDKVAEAPSGKMVLGGAAGASLAQYYGRRIEAASLSTDDVVDEFATEWDDRTGREEVIWGSDVAGTLKDTGVAALRLYLAAIAPGIEPVSVEREFELSWPDAPFTLTGYLDLETADGAVCDYKMTGQRWSEDKAAAELQPTVYLAARRAEGDPASGFDYHAMIRTKQPKAEVVPTPRTERQLDLLTHRVFSIARSMQWRWANDCWAGTGPDTAWLCRSCSYREHCAWSLA